jgi:hypothetical protein
VKKGVQRVDAQVDAQGVQCATTPKVLSGCTPHKLVVLRFTATHHQSGLIWGARRHRRRGSKSATRSRGTFDCQSTARPYSAEAE